MVESTEKLLKDLCTLYNQFQGVEDKDQKKHFAYLFLFLYEKIDNDETELYAKRLLHSAPSQFSCYFQELVRDIICAAGIIHKTESEVNVVLGNSSDITAIITLREFLTEDIGKNILNYLLKCDIKIISCKQELTRLLLNLLPNSRWDNRNSEIFEVDRPMTIEMILNSINLLKKSSFTTNHNSNSSRPNSMGHSQMSPKTDKESHAPNNDKIYITEFEYDTISSTTSNNQTSNILYDIEKFQKFKKRKKSSIEIASILIDLLAKIIETESNRNVTDEKAITLEVIKFILSNFINLTFESNAFEDLRDKEILKLKLISLLILCLNNLFIKRNLLLDLSDMQFILKRLIYDCVTVKYGSSVVDKKYGEVIRKYQRTANLSIFYMIFAALNNILIFFEGKFTKIHIISTVIESNQIDLIGKYLIEFLTNCDDRKVIDNGRYDGDDTSVKRLIDVIIKIVSYLKQPSIASSKRGRRKVRSPNGITNQKNHHETGSFPCALEKLMFTVFAHVRIQNQRSIIKLFDSHWICCCTCNMDSLNVLIGGKFETQVQKFLYKFSRKKILKVIFDKSNCVECETKIKSIDFQQKLIALYKTKRESIQQTVDLINYLKHLLKLSFLLTYDISSQLLVEIILPVFRAEKVKEESSWNYDILLCCINMFINYLNDLRLIKSFFVEENIQHLKDLIYKPQLANSVCNLIRIGLESFSFLGENDDQQINLTQQLVILQSDAVMNATCVLENIYIKLNLIKRRDDDEKNPLQILLANNRITIYQVLCLATIFWKHNLQLCKISEQFREHFSTVISSASMETTKIDSTKSIEPNGIGEEDTDMYYLTQLVYNTLSCFLYNQHRNQTENAGQKQKTTPSSAGGTSSDSLWQQQQQQMDLRGAKSNLVGVHDVGIVEGNYSSPPSTTTSLMLSSNDFNVEPTEEPLSAVGNYLLRLSGSDTLSSSGEEQCASSHFTDIEKRGVLLQSTSEQNEKNFTELIAESSSLGDFDETSSNQSIFLDKLKSGENSLIFDIKNQNSAKNSVKTRPNLIKSSNSDLMCETTFVGQSQQFLMHGVSKLNDILSASVFGFLFSQDVKTPTDCDKIGNPIKDTEHEENRISVEDLFDSCNVADCKRLLLQLFEYFMAVIVGELSNGQKMQSSLQKMKSLLIAHYLHQWNTPDETTSATNAIVQALQSLLKVAEMTTTKCCPNPLMIPATLTPQNQQQSPESNDSPDTTLSRESRGSGDTEFHSVKGNLSLSQVESDLEPSETETEEFYMTADEGYEADAETQEHSNGEEDVVQLLCPYMPSSRYRLNIVHEGICRIIIEILIELSKKCVKDSVQWANSLSQLANRLYVVRESLGGPLFLIKGFMPVLECNESSLKDFQKSILELLTNFNTPEVLSAYLNILASEDPPADLMIPFLSHICLGSIRIQPGAEIVFPTKNDGSLSSTCNPLLFEQIKQVHNYHEYHKLDTPFTQATYITPLNYLNFKPWNLSGFTISTWIEIKSDLPTTPTAQTESSENEVEKIAKRTHLISVGTNQLILSIYITHELHLLFELTKPNAEVSKKPIKPSRSSPDLPSAVVSEKSKTSRLCLIRRKRKLKRDGVQIHEPSDSLTSPETKETMEMQQPCTSSAVPGRVVRSATSTSPTSAFASAMESTKLALRNSLSQFHLFHSGEESEYSLEETSIELKHTRLLKSKWTHLCFAVEVKQKEIQITVIIDGSDSYVLPMPCKNIVTVGKNENLNIIGIGQKSERVRDEQESNESKQNIIKYGISNIMLFRKCFPNRKLISNLTALGPDYTNLIQCQVGNTIPNYGFLNYSKLFKFEPGSFIESMRILENSLVAFYSAHDANEVVGFGQTDETEDFGIQIGVSMFGGGGETKKISSMQIATYLSGGLPCLLYLFARAVEVSSDWNVQTSALDLLLAVAHSDSYLYTEFVQNDYLSLIGSVIKTEKCVKGPHLLRSIVNNACNIPIITSRNDALQVVQNSSSCLIYPNLIVHVIQRYSDWNSNNAKESSEVLDMLFSCLLALVREKHPHQSFNLMQLTKAGILQAMFNFCKIYIVESPNPVFISQQSAESFVSILSIFGGAPPSASFLDEIMQLLLLLQKPSECFVTHDRAKFYFLVTPDLPVKTKRISLPLPLPSRQIRQNVRERKRTAPPQLNQTQRLQRSMSDEKPTTSAKALLKQRSETRGEDNENMTNQSIFIKFCENLESLESIADCSRMSHNTINFFDPIESSKLHKSLQTLKKQQKIQKMRSRFSRVVKNKLRYYSRGSTDSDSDPKRMKSVSESGIEVDLLTAKEYDIVNSDEVSNEGNKKSKRLIKLEYHNSFGIVKIQEGLFNLLKDFLLILPDNTVNEVVTHYVKINILLVLANHRNADVRAAIVRLLNVLSDRLPHSEIQIATKQLYWHHLANQLALNTANENLVTALIQWISGTFINFNQLLLFDDLRIKREMALNSIIAILPQTLNETDLAITTFQFLENIYAKCPEYNNYMIENGLIPSLVKTLFKFYLNMKPNNQIIEPAMQPVLIIIAQRAIISSGHINILWELLNTLAYNQDHHIFNIKRGFRSVQAVILLRLLHEFLPSNEMPSTHGNMKFKSSNIRLVGSTLSKNEVSLRFNLLIDRAIQFLVCTNPAYILSQPEVKLFELLISFGLSGIVSCCRFFAWGLSLERGQNLRNFIINNLWRLCRADMLPSIICDGVIIKTLLWACLTNEAENYHLEEFENLKKLCKSLGVTERGSWNIAGVLEKLDLDRENCQKEIKPAIEKSIHKYESMAHSCIEYSMVITRVVAELQNSERKLLISQMREHDESFVYRQWPLIIERMTHQGAPWFCKKTYPSSWELDDTEGPSRVRVRLRRCRLNMDNKFKSQESQQENHQDTSKDSDKDTPLKYLTSKNDPRLNFSLNSQVLLNFPAKYLPVDGEVDGELIITGYQLIFVATHRCQFYYMSCDIQDISEIWMRRYQHQESGFEVFVESNKSHFFALHNASDRNSLKELFSDKIFQCPDQSKLLVLTQQWREGQLTNWEYLMTLNQISGRTYNDLMQYPVFPWILADFESSYLDLSDIKSFRRLDKPIAVQHEGNESHYVDNYVYMEQTMASLGSLHLQPYHYSSHYSNSGTVLHFLVRIPPFTSYFLRYQDNNFDLPDRTFHSIHTTWKLASNDSSTDVKELVPEFFCLPEMFENTEGFNFGVRQSGEVVSHVALPPWSMNNFRLFVLIHRQALESRLVRKNIHNWIDLIFGYKQTGKAAIDAINVFHPATYSTFSVSDITDPIERKALETMIKTYGQMPKQLLKAPHPESNDLNYPAGQPNVVASVRGLRWGIFTGSPQLPEPRMCNVYIQPGMLLSKLVSFANTNVVYAIEDRSTVMQGLESDIYNLISWNHDDGVIRIGPLSEPVTASKPLAFNNRLDEITASGSDPNANTLWFGHKSGRITVYQFSSFTNPKYNKHRQTLAGMKLSYNSACQKISTKSPLLGPTVLICHTDEITAIALSAEFKIAVSVGNDGLVVIWDANSFSFIRTIERPSEIRPSPISLVAISPTLGDILTVHWIQHNSENGNRETTTTAEECFEVTEETVDDFVNISMNLNGKSLMRLHSVNAKYVNHCVLDDRILSVCYSYVKEGVGVNVIATGFENGFIRLWSSWDLSLVKEIRTSNSDVISLTYSTYQHLVVLTKDNYIQVWESEGLQGNAPKFPQIVFQRSSSGSN